MEWVQWVAAIAGAISVYLSARENIWSWPTAIVNVGLYIFVFYESGLYSDMGLQVVYLALSIYGWYEWLYGGAQRTALHVTRASALEWSVGAIGAIVFVLVIGRFTSTLPGVAFPYLDASLTAISLVAQWMMTRKKLENWVLWIIADIVYVPMYLVKHLAVTSALYVVFLGLAVMGLVEWRRSYARDREARLAPA
ncbi:MAG TPA: nicotinamide riboside transporter PnuC [Gemmatimonadaceae bacterium]|nr:nicotinamide riboside transporter PnuC [Gemmatimonadaceae bacterium]